MTRSPSYPPVDMEHPELREKLLAKEAPIDLDRILARTRAAVEADVGVPARVRRWSTARRTVLVLSVAGTAAGLTALLTPRPDLWTGDTTRTLIVVAGTLAAALGAVALAMRPEWRPEPREALAWSGLGGALFLPLGLMLLPETQPALHVDGSAWVVSTASCFAFGTAVGAVVLGTWRLVERRTHAGTLRWVTAIAGACAVGAMSLQLHCPVTQVDHLVLGHGAVGLVWALAAGAGLTLIARAQR